MSTSAPPLARPEIVGTFGVCATTHWIASAVAQSVLERGGNAFDAAAAAGFVLHVVEPHLNGPAGDMVALIAPAGGPVQVLCGQGPAPAAATIEHFGDEGLEAVPGAGALAAAVPGAVDAWLLLLRDRGSWELADVLGYAIHYAGRGYPVLGATCAVIEQVRGLFSEDWPTSAALWLPDGKPPVAGDMLLNPAYAEVLRGLVDASRSEAGLSREARIDRARESWSSWLATEVDAFVRTTPHRHSSGSVHHGVIAAADIRGFAAHFEPPIVGDFGGHTIYKAGPWSQGPVLLQALAILEQVPPADLDLDTAGGVHHVVEALKLAMADRECYYGDGVAEEVVHILLSSEYAAYRRTQIGERASNEFRPGRGFGLPEPYLPPLRSDAQRASIAVGEPTVRVTGETRGDTCHIDVVDRWGNAISATPSGGWLQSSPAIPSLGFALGTRLQMTHLDPLSPSALRPGKRPRTTLSPTLMRKDATVTALGTPGGDQQDQWQLVYLIRTLLGGQSPQAAIESPMFHTVSFPGSFWPRTWEPGAMMIEDRAGDGVIEELRQRGHQVRRAGAWALGRLSSVSGDRTSGSIVGAANPRGAQGYAVGR